MFSDVAPDQKKTPQSWTHVGHAQGGFLSVSMAAKALGVNVKTVTRWCESGKLSARPHRYGQKITYKIPSPAIELFKASAMAEQKAKRLVNARVEKGDANHLQLVSSWAKALAAGEMTGRPYSPRTVADYVRNMNLFLQKHPELSFETLKAELMKINPVHFCKREHLFKASLCFSRYLVKENLLKDNLNDESVPESIKALCPKRHLPPKRLTVQEEGLEKLLDACSSPQDKAIILLIVNTGLRAAEACSLMVSDVNLGEGCLIVRKGKGNKRRVVGLNPVAIAGLLSWINAREGVKPFHSLFMDKYG